MEPTPHSAAETFSSVFSVRHLQCAGIGVLAVLVFSKIYCLLTVGRCKSARSMEGKTAIVTGANTGVGLETAKELCRRKARVILACRDLDKARLVAAEIGGETGVMPVCMQLDLCSFKSIRRFAEQITEREKRLDVLINNAGKIAPPKKTETDDGFESTFQTNHLGPFLLTNLLLDLLKKSAPSRVVVVGSNVMFYVGKMDRSNFDFQRSYRQSKVYSTTKLYNMLFTVELSRRLIGTGVTVNCGHPGVVKTDLGTRGTDAHARATYWITSFLGKTPEEGAQTSIHLAVSEEVEGVSGKFFSDCRQKWMPPWGTNSANAQFLWKASETMTGLC